MSSARRSASRHWLTAQFGRPERRGRRRSRSGLAGDRRTVFGSREFLRPAVLDLGPAILRADRRGDRLHLDRAHRRKPRLAERRARQVERLAVAADDVREVGERLDLVADHPAHRLGALARLLRQLEHAALDLLAGGAELLLQLLHRQAHFLGGFAEAPGRIADHLAHLLEEQAIGVAHDLGSLAGLGGRGAVERLEVLDHALGRRRGVLGEHAADRGGVGCCLVCSKYLSVFSLNWLVFSFILSFLVEDIVVSFHNQIILRLILLTIYFSFHYIENGFIYKNKI